MSKRISRLLLAALALIVVTALAAAPQPANAEEVTGDTFLSKIIGEYQPLFEGATFNKEYDHYWHDYAAAVAGESSADSMVAYMKASIGSDKYGENAEPGQFFCGFIDADRISFGGTDGKTVTFTKADGTQVTHEYAFVKEAAATGNYEGMEMAMDGYLYQATDENNDGFEYLLMFPDTPDTTYHLEFRYAPTEEEVTALLTGSRAYWVGSAIQTSALTEATEETLQNVISLFVVENLAGVATDESATQRTPLVGTWDGDMSAFPEEYANAKMYIALDKDGSGRTFLDMAGTGEYTVISEYTFFAYDTDANDNKDAGIYLVLSDEGVSPASYEVTEADGVKTLKFTSVEGDIAYTCKEGKVDNAITVKTASKKFKVKKLKKKAASFEIGAEAYSPVTYQVTKGAKKSITVSDTGKVTLKKGAKKGTYKVTVTAAETDVYTAATRLITIKVK